MKLASAIVITSIALLSASTPVQAGLFSLPFGASNSRPACNTPQDFNPSAYTQSTVQEDCSNFGFPFLAEKLISYYDVIANPKIIAVIEKIGTRVGSNGSINLNQQTSHEILGWGGLSLPPELRGQETDKFQEANQIYTRLYDSNSQPLNYASIGKNDTGRPLEFRLKDRVTYCKKLQTCLDNPDSDLSSLEQGDFQNRCFEPQAFQITYQDGEQETYQDDQVCSQALPILEKYAPNYTQALKDSQFFTSSTDKNLLTQFLGIDPTPKRVELVAVCVSANPVVEERTSQTAQSHPDSSNRLDCQEFVVNATNLCDGVSRQAQAWLPYAQTIDYNKPYELRPMGSTSEPRVSFTTADTIITDPTSVFRGFDSVAVRKREYAKRINGEFVLEEIDESERGGYINTNNDMFISSSPLRLFSEIFINNPNDTSSEKHAARTWYTLASPQFSRCLEDMSTDLFLSQTSYHQPSAEEARESKIGLRGQADINSSITRSLGTSSCDYIRDEEGNIATDINGELLIDPQSCTRISAGYGQDGDFDQEVELPGGITQRSLFLHGLTGFFKSFNLIDNAKGVTCDFFGWLTGNPAPQCTNEYYAGSPQSPGSSGNNSTNPNSCEERSPAALGAPSTPAGNVTIDYTIDFKNPSDEICLSNQELIDWVKDPSRYPNSLITPDKIKFLETRAKTAGLSPAFTLAIWIEESGASDYCILPDYETYDFGAVRGPAYSFEAQLSIFTKILKTYQTSDTFSCREDPDVSFEDFMLFFSEGGCQTEAVQGRYFSANRHFPGRVKFVYEKIKEGC